MLLDYHPFGMAMPGRSFANADYRYGFNGQEKTDEIAGSGNHINFDERAYDSRRGQWISIDGAAKNYPSHTPYGFTLQNPIAHHEVDGNVVETGWDVFNVALDVASLAANLATGNYLDAAIDGAGLLYDGVATVVPGLPGGAGAVIKASRAGKAAIRVVNSIENIVKLSDKAHGIIKAGVNGGGQFVQRHFKDFDKAKGAAWYKYQEQINGVSGSFEYAIGKGKDAVRFDGFKDGVLLEAKGFHQFLLKAKKTTPIEMYGNMQDQLRRQVTAAKGGKLEWHFAEQATMDQFREHLERTIDGTKLLKSITTKVTKYEGK